LDKPELKPSPVVSAPSRKLRILLVVNLEWDSRLGAVRVFMELAEQWRAAGHSVEKFSASEAFKPGSSPARAALRQIIFGYKAARFVRRNVGRFDVIDALIGSLHGSPRQLDFRGLLVVRSVGLYRLYERFDRLAQERWPGVTGRFFTRIFYNRTNQWFRRLSDAAVQQADLINVPNDEERQYLLAQGFAESKITVQPYGLDPEQREALGRSSLMAKRPMDRPKVSFVGMWAPRKGSRDWREIVRLVWQKVPETRFCFLGTMVDADIILEDLGIRFSERVQVVPEYSQAELPGLLADCAVGAFPSYVEGFGIAVLEQLAAGIPTVAFNVAGPRDMLARVSSELLVPAGDVPKFAEVLIRLLQSDPAPYEALSAKCRAVAAQFSWPRIASQTADTYQDHLAGRAASANPNYGR
jgi:glycosyltransferase involved in cell wall biosynthesis